MWEKAYADITRWVAGNAANRKIAYVAHTGDIIENNIRRPFHAIEHDRERGEDHFEGHNGNDVGEHDWAGVGGSRYLVGLLSQPTRSEQI